MKVNALSFKYGATDPSIIEKITLEIEKNQSVAIVGPNGSGKTTLAFCLCGIIPHIIRGLMEGSIIINGKDSRLHSFEDIIQDFGVIFQNPDSQFVTTRVKDEIAFGIENLNLPEAEVESRINDIIHKFNLSELLDKAPQDLSMGQKQRVALASVIAMKPKILLLDEPASTLDPRGQRWFLEAIKELKGQLTIIMLSHDFNYVRRIADRVIVIHDKNVKFDGTPDLLCRKDVLKLFGLNENHRNSLAIPKSESIIEVKNLYYRYPRSDKFSINDLSFVVKKGEVLGVVGPNGSGKSTLLFLMQGLRKPNHGKILIEEKDVTKMDFPNLALKQGVLFQNPDHQIFTSSVEDELRFGLENLGLKDEEIKKRISMTSDFLNFKDLSCDPHSLSYGQRKILSLATVLVMNPEVILLDEPELGLDVGFMDKFEKHLIRLNRAGKTFVIVSHDLDLIENLTHRLIFLEDGRITMEGPTKEKIKQVRDYFDH